jgi:hypothetical protein
MLLLIFLDSGSISYSIAVNKPEDPVKTILLEPTM